MRAPCSPFPTTTAAVGSPGRSSGGAVGPCGRAGGAMGGRADEAAAGGTQVDPALADACETAAERLTGSPAASRAGRLEIYFADETELAELVEALEPRARPEP